MAIGKPKFKIGDRFYIVRPTGFGGVDIGIEIEEVKTITETQYGWEYNSHKSSLHIFTDLDKAKAKAKSVIEERAEANTKRIENYKEGLDGRSTGRFE